MYGNTEAIQLALNGFCFHCLFSYGRGALGRTVLTFDVVSLDSCATSAFGRGAEGLTVETFDIAILDAITTASVTSNARKRFAVVDMVVLPHLCEMMIWFNRVIGEFDRNIRAKEIGEQK